ncbi:WD40 repeat [Macleaya cordata]|uniref:WD40 repeat n=1 Tax=Macleaya cordata TaxID=56857 RepID=A0A200QV66_MACCD|nr:WD40 repeat [Macleaya cordata]
MGIVSCPFVCHSGNESLSHSNNHLNSDSASLSSQPSLPTVPSLTSQSSTTQKTFNTNHQCISTLKGHSSYVFSLTLSGKFLYSGSSDKEIRIWSRENLNPQQVHDQISMNNIVAIGNGAVKSVVVYGNKLFSAHQDHKIRVWLTENKDTHHQKYKKLATLPTLSDRLKKLVLPKNQIQVRRHHKCTWVHHVDAISGLALSIDGSLLYSVSWDRTFKIWRTSDFKCLESVGNAHDDAINAVALSNDGLVYTGSADKKIKVWKKVAGEKKHSLMATLEKHKSAVNALALSSDGSTLYSGACDRSIVVWEKDGGGGTGMVVVGALRGHTKAILCLGIVSDLVFSGSADKTVRIWRRGVDNGYSCLAILEGHTGPVKCLTATVDHSNSTSSDGTSSYLVYSGSLDCEIKVWHISVPFL